MRRMTMVLAALTFALAMATASLGLASGGLDSGGSGGSGGGGGTSTGGGGGTSTASCSPVTNYTATTGYVPYGAGTTDIWVNYTLKSCSGGSGSYTMTLTETDVSGVNATYVRSMTMQPTGKSLSYSLGNLPLSNSVTYSVTYTVTVYGDPTKVVATGSSTGPENACTFLLDEGTYWVFAQRGVKKAPYQAAILTADLTLTFAF